MNKKRKIKNKGKHQQQTRNPKILIISLITFTVLLTGIILFDQLYKRSILTIEGDKYYMDDLRYYFYAMEQQYDYVDKMFGGSYWDMAIDNNGTTVREYAKTLSVENAIMTEVLYREAMSKGYFLTTEELNEVAAEVASFKDTLTPAEIRHNRFTDRYLTDIISRIKLGNRFRDDMVESFNIDKDAILAEIDFEEHRQYDIEYLFVSTQKDTDGEGNYEDVSDEEKAAALIKINNLYKEAIEVEDWTTLVPEEDEEVLHDEYSFAKADLDRTIFSEEVATKIMTMSNNEVSNVIETETGYYIIRMLNNQSYERFDMVAEREIEDAENAAFDDYYTELLSNYAHHVNQKALRQFTMGKITIVN